MNACRTQLLAITILYGVSLYQATVASTEPLARSDGCPATDVGVLASDGSVTINGDTCPSANDFEDDGHDCSYGQGGNDEIFQFTVDTSGYWQLDTMSICAGWDTSLMVREDTGSGCPGDFHDCDGDGGHGPCGAYESALFTFLTTETTYYLVVDSWSTFTCGDFGVNAYLVQPACTSDTDCDDGLFCDGSETCDFATGDCVAGSHPCASYQTCDEDDDVCISPDPCISWLGGSTAGSSEFPYLPYSECSYTWVLDDIELRDGASHDLISYSLPLTARALVNPVGTMYFVDLALWEVEEFTCMPWAVIPDSLCYLSDDIDPGGAPSDVFRCEPGPVALPDNSGDFNRCEIDFFLGYRTEEFGTFFAEAFTQQLIGGPAADDDLGVSVLYLEDCPPGTGTFSYVYLGDDVNRPADFGDSRVCTEPYGVCCIADTAVTCQEEIFEDDCVALGGEWTVAPWYAPVDCGDPDGDALPTICGDNCPDVYNPNQEDCDGGATPEGDVCELDPNYADDDADGACNVSDGCPTDPNKTEPGICGCHTEDIDTDGDGAFDCHDPCPTDPLKWLPGTAPGYAPGVCGCHVIDTDTDQDGVADCNDLCPGVDDSLFAPDCVTAIPAVSTWGLIVMGLLLLAAAKIRFSLRHRAPA